MSFKSTFSKILLAGLFFSAVVFFQNNFEKAPIKIDKQSSAINFSENFYRIGFGGYKRLVSDILWITTLLESDTSHYKNNDLNSWMFLRFKSIIELDPKFLEAYTFGGQYLSIVKDDLLGASGIFEKGLEVYPENYSLNFNAAFLYAMEMGDHARGLELYKKIKDHPSAPKFIDSLIAKLEYENSGDLELTYKVLKEMFIKEKRDEMLKKKLAKDLYAIRAMLDLECLNEGKKKNCNRFDLNGKPYIYDGTKYISQDPFTPYQLHTRKGSR